MKARSADGGQTPSFEAAYRDTGYRYRGLRDDLTQDLCTRVSLSRLPAKEIAARCHGGICAQTVQNLLDGKTVQPHHTTMQWLGYVLDIEIYGQTWRKRRLKPFRWGVEADAEAKEAALALSEKVKL